MFHGTIIEEQTNHREWIHYNENIIEDQKDHFCSSLPGTKFWGQLKKLAFLYLHDSGFAELKNIRMLFACSSLINWHLPEKFKTNFNFCSALKKVSEKIKSVIEFNA
ncbi:hypothetical protein FD754_020318 [Muntiacus muntjak]|uniref:Uncharacterized protein n=1 Tax=Muntiacus muntjak TaxID=9888 RepID=A0A5N3V2J0_MUNMU|nr:hypothetical protein FD754_020318 [Muntiacus muntjak]